MFLLTSLALAQDLTPTTVENHIAVLKQDTGNTLPDATNIAVAISCQPATTSRFGYLAPALTDYTSENAAFLTAVEARSDVHYVASVHDATPEETIAWFKKLDEEFDEPVRELIITVSCPAWGGDTDEEVLMMNGGTLPFTDLLTVAAPIAQSSIWIIDASRNVSSALSENVSSFGPTADDVVKYGILPDAFAISSSAPGKHGAPGLIGAAAKVLAESKGGSIDLQSFYYLGMKPAVPTLELFTSMGVMEPDTWNGNLNRQILLGGPLIVPVAEVKPPTAQSFKLRPSHGVIAAGGASLIAGGVFALQASKHYDVLDTYNRVGGETQAELDEAVGGYRTNRGIAIGLGAVGLAAIGGGVTWTVFDNDETTVTVVPTGTGIAATGSW